MSTEIKTIEVYGFVGWISSFALFAMYLLWVILPAEVLAQVGLPQMPDKSWALAIPSVVLVTFMFFFLLGQGLHMVLTKELDDVNIIQDNFSKISQSNVLAKRSKNAIPEVFDIPITVANRILYDKYK